MFMRVCACFCVSLNSCLHWSSTAYLYLCLYLDFYAQHAIEDFIQMRSMQDFLEDESLRVRIGLMGKQWSNWASLFFSREMVLVRMQRSPLVTLIKALADKHLFFGQICHIDGVDVDGHEQHKVILISLPH